ncbi:50S ribosomal protein L11 methyltransferase [Cohnella thailandensis]|uniref:Ribosomal protein L11 methyltransferase n=1 Tax=Cohnella thailandensis TaxID=557557 RepID=A0A841T2B4_9BACL|nr:50S ribosomal protein L11 methyltransferase [Cohnella thailandensis]MBB6636210.1 50S ribosomal protein L11 methyltransferase [Cohnella thailandensis]MBP1973821.1 ribosomal protein L11 methyltransferase [Cohnella thailandensis]
MRWFELTVFATEPSQEMVAHYLTELGAGGVSIEESWSPDKPRDTSLGQWYDKPLNDIPAGYAYIKGYFSEDADMDGIAAEMNELLKGLPEFGYDAGDFEISRAEVDEEDWAHAWKKYFKPIAVSERLTIKPTWEEYEAKPDELIIELDPGMAFGTGTHPTTALCLRTLEGAINEGDNVIDVGTGSGILAIGAIKLGANRVLALDLDPVAVSSATENVKLNGLEDRIEIRLSDLLGVLQDSGRQPGEVSSVRPPVDLVVANILAEIILLFIGDVYDVLKPGGIYIASGIYKNKEDDVASALQAAGFEIIDRVRQDDWIAFVSGKPKGEDE